MKPEDVARAAADRSPLLAELHEFNMALRKRHAAAAWLEASTAPVEGTKSDCAEGWQGYRATQEVRRKALAEAEMDLAFSRRRAETALSRPLTAEEADLGFVGSCRPGWAGVPAKQEYLKPGRRLESDPPAPKRPPVPEPAPLTPAEEARRAEQKRLLEGAR